MLPDHGPLADDLKTANVEVTIRPMSVLRRQLASPAGLTRIAAAAARDALVLARLIRTHRISIVHSNTSVVLGGAAAAALARVPHVWHIRESYSRFPRLWPLHRRLLATAAALPCVSHATAAQFGANPRVQVIPDGLAVQIAVGPPHETNDPPVIAIVGRISDWKGQDVLVRALAERPLAEIGATALIAGEPWPGAEGRRRDVLDLADQLGVHDRVRLVGFQGDVTSVYRAADLVAFPSTQPDPLPGAAIEAAAAGSAVLASDHGGLPEIVRDGETGRLVPPGDPVALAHIARELIDDPPQRERLGAAAARDVHARFAPERLLGSLQALYDTL